MKDNSDYVIVNPEQVLNDWRFIRKLPRDFVITDEVTSIKNFRAKPGCTASR